MDDSIMILLNVQDWYVYFADWWYDVKLELTILHQV